MALSLISKRTYRDAFIYVILISHVCNGFYLPGSYMHTYSTGDEIVAKVNSLTSIETELPFSYYSLPYCKPQGGIKKSAENLGELLMGDQIDNSPYRFRMNVNESVYLCTTSRLSENEVKLLKQRTRDLYQVNMILDNLPAMRFATQNGIKIQWTGFPVGYTPPNTNDDYIINHLKFKVLVHEYEGAGVEIIGTWEEGMGIISEADKKKASGYEIVGFEVLPCSVKYDPEKMAKLHRYDNVTSLICPLEQKQKIYIAELKDSYRSIEEMAQVVRYHKVDLKTLFSQAKENALLEKNSCQKSNWAFVHAKELNYANPSGWKFTDASAELIGSLVLHVDGKYPTENLEKLTYDVSFVVLLKDNLNIESPVSLTLTPPDGSTQVNGYELMGCPRNTPISLKAGEFLNSFDSGDFKFALDGSENATMKKGLVIYGVHISPPNA